MGVKDWFKGVVGFFPRQALLSEVEGELPMLLGETAAHLRSAMTFEQALSKAAESGDTALHVRLQKAFAGVSAERSLSSQLLALSDEIGSEQLTRVIGLVLPAMRGGSASAALLDELRDDLEERAALRREFMVSTRSFVALIRLSVLMLMPALLALSMMFLDKLGAIIGETPLGAADLGMATLAAGSLPETALIAKLAFVMVGGTALFAALLESVIQKGSWLAGLKKAPVYIALTEIIFIIAQKVLITLI